MKALVRFGARHARIITWGTLGLIWAGLVLSSTSTTVDAHKAKTSPFSYNVDIFPLLRDNCGRCHAEGGPAPMSLMTYDKDGGAIAWAESMREMLLIGAMPPWYADTTGPAVRNNHSLSTRELDKIITWATGGTPHGDLSLKLPAVSARTGWAGGTPDLELPMPQPYTLGPGVMRASNEVSIPTNFTDAKWVKAADLLPGVASAVRRAYISVDGGPMLQIWEPGDDVVDPPSGAAFKVPAGAKLKLKVDYKKSWQDEQKAVNDKSVIGLYFTEEPLSGKSIESVAIDAQPRVHHRAGHFEQQHEIGFEPRRGPPQQFLEVPDLEAAAVALVHHRGRHEPIADHVLAPGQGRLDDLVHVLGFVGRVQQRFGPIIERGVRRVEHDRTDRGSDGSAARLAGEKRAEISGQARGLR